MQALPHHYPASAQAQPDSTVTLTTVNCEPIETAPPPEFGGPGDRWSPETLLVGAIADCYILSFKAIARASGLTWLELSCTANGVLDRVDRTLLFTEVQIHATLTIPPEMDADQAHKLLAKAERSCLVSNSLSAKVHLESEVLNP